jgi:hypothetical protein
MRVVAAAALIACTAKVATATPPEEGAPVSSEETVVPSYRNQTLAADGIAVGLIVISGAVENGAVAGVGVGVYLVGAPFVHLTKERRGLHALASVAMRVGLPLAGVLIGDRIPQDCGGSPCMASPPPGVLVGLLAGAVTASALDAIFLAKGDAPKTAPQPGWTPVAAPTQDGFALGVAGQF